MNAPAPAAILLQSLRELWVHTGTACNLSCPFCHEGSKPGDARIGAPTLAQIAPLLDEACALGVERFAFTGGEPLILKGILDILLHALKLRPALVLTNGTAPFIRRAHQLAMLRQAPHPVEFRVSIDHPDESRHDAGRGLKNFRKALEGLKLLHAAGFRTGITRQWTPGEDPAAVAHQFRLLMRKHRLPEDLNIVALPELGTLEMEGPVPASEPAWQPQERESPAPACARSRMLLLRQGALRLHACPLTDDSETFDTGSTLKESVLTAITPAHRRCRLCLGPGVDYAGARASG